MLNGETYIDRVLHTHGWTTPSTKNNCDSSKPLVTAAPNQNHLEICVCIRHKTFLESSLIALPPTYLQQVTPHVYVESLLPFLSKTWSTTQCSENVNHRLEMKASLCACILCITATQNTIIRTYLQSKLSRISTLEQVSTSNSLHMKSKNQWLANRAWVSAILINILWHCCHYQIKHINR